MALELPRSKVDPRGEPNVAPTIHAMQKRHLAGTLLAASALAAPATAQSTGAISVRASMNGTGELPALSSKSVKATGRLVGTLKPTKSGYQFNWYLTYNNLSGTATFANIERGTKKTRGATVTFLCSPCKSGAHGSFYASPGELALLQQGGLYVNVRTKKHPSGEIRGRLDKS
jgi:hypothetical protein